MCFILSDALSTELVMASPDAEKQRIQTWTALDTAIQTLLADQPTLESVLHDELKTRFRGHRFYSIPSVCW